jgi:cytochrome c-type biogenesis protein CcmE
MSRLDEELARAAEEGGAVPPVTAPAGTRATESDGAEPRAKARWALLGVLLVMGGGLSALILTSSGNAAIYSAKVDELVREKERFAGRNVRVEGMLVKGTLVKRDAPCEHRFVLEHGGARIAVHYPECSIPDTFRDVPYTDVSVTAEGELEGGVFQASHIMAKCPSKYEEKNQNPLAPKPGKAGMPHDPESLRAFAPSGAAPYGSSAPGLGSSAPGNIR